MSENREMLIDTAEAVFSESGHQGFAPVAEAGFASLLISEQQGGFGGDWGDLFAVLRVAGGKAMCLPVGETIIAAKLLSDAGKPVPDGPLELEDKPLGAFVRVAQAAGAMDAVLAMSVEHANTRVQFGKPLAKFQAVQQSLATLAVEAAAVNVAGAAAAAALDRGDALFEIAAAKLRANIAIGIGTAIAHQVHGAIGFTQEYPLHLLTSSLMRWRSEYGNDAYWAGILGGQACARGGAGLWVEMTHRG
ncbi:MAG: acyl-CoA dehydrogenase family protein [Sphingorhabdus sp.]